MLAPLGTHEVPSDTTFPPEVKLNSASTFALVMVPVPNPARFVAESNVTTSRSDTPMPAWLPVAPAVAAEIWGASMAPHVPSATVVVDAAAELAE